MKKIISIFLSVLCLCMFSACDFIDEFNQGFSDGMKAQSVVYFDDYDYSVQFPSGWEKLENDNFDLRCSLNDGEQHALFWVYNDLDLSKDSTRNSIYKEGIDNILSARQNVELIEDEKTATTGNKTITTILYSAEKESTKFYYYYCLVEIEGTDDYFWVLFTAIPSVAQKNIDKWNSITESIAPVTKSEQ